MYEDTIKKYGLSILAFVVVLSLIFADGGFLGYFKTKIDIAKVNTEIQRLEKDNDRLTRELERLKTDDKYLEEIVRTKHGLLRPGEKLYRVEK